MSPVRKAAAAALVLLVLAGGWVAASVRRRREKDRLYQQARLTLDVALKAGGSVAQREEALAAAQALVARYPAEWWPAYSYVFAASRAARRQDAADEAFARMKAARDAVKAKEGRFAEEGWERAAARYASDRFEAAMVPRDKALMAGDERELLPATKAAAEAYDAGAAVAELIRTDLGQSASPETAKDVSASLSFLEENKRIAEQMRRDAGRWSVRPELARAHALYLQGVNRYEAKDGPGAAVLLSQALALDASHAYALAVRSFVALDDKRDADAAADARAALALFTAPDFPDKEGPIVRTIADVRGALAAADYHQALAKAASRRRADKADAARLLAEANDELARGLQAAPDSGQCLRLKDEMAGAPKTP